jgi:DNA-binding FadR family transcriptional regulator
MFMSVEAMDTEAVLTALRAFIAEGGYKPGDRLPAERDLIVRLGLTRTALRKGFEALEREGSIWRHVGKGTFLASQGIRSGAGNLSDLTKQVTPVQLMRARLSLEPSISREAAIHASDEAVARLKICRDKAVAAATWDEYEEQDDALHRMIAEASNNILLLSLFDHLNAVRRAVAWNSVIRKSEQPPRDHSSFSEHDRIVAAVEARDPAAAHAAMRAHLGSVSVRLFGEY